jgi:replicative DNA helicase
MDRSAEAEYNIIGAILKDQRIIEKITKLQPEDFTIENCAIVYEAAVDASERGKTFDGVIAADVLKKRMGEREAATFVLECMDITPTTSNVELHAKLVHRYAGARQIKESVQETLVSDNPQDIATGLITICQTFLQGEKSGRVKTLSDALQEMINEKPDNTIRIDTGFPKLDSILKGLNGGNFVLIGARPGVGKSAFALDIARTAAGKGNKILLFSMEMLAVELAERIVARDPRLNLDVIIDKKYSTEDWTVLTEICSTLSKLPLLISDEPSVTVSKIRSQAMATPGLKMIIVDFMTLMTSSKKYDSRNLEVGAMSRDLKNLSMEMKIPIVALAQLNRDKDETDKPELRDLRDSGELEQNANKVIFLWNLDAPVEGAPQRVGVCVAKNRRGNRGISIMRFDGSHMRFIETDEKYVPKKKNKVFGEGL